MDLSSRIYARRGASTLSQDAFIRFVAFFTLAIGLLVVVGAALSRTWQFSWPLLIVTIVGAFIGVFMFSLSDNPVVSGLGVSLMSLCLGLMIGPVLVYYSAVVVMKAVVLTGIIMVVMSVAGILFPGVFRGIGPFLMGALVLLIVAGFAQVIFLAFGFQDAGNIPVIPWIGVAVFTGFVAYDWSRALDMPYTVDNAIDAAGGLILDAVNLFLYILRIMGNSSSSDD